MPDVFRSAATLIASASLALGAALSAPAADEHQAPSADAILAGLLAGRDMAPAMAEYVAVAESATKRLRDADRFRPDSVHLAYKRSLDTAARSAARVARSTRPWLLGDSLDGLLADLGQLHAQQMLLETRARRIYDRVLAAGAGAEIVARARAALDRIAGETEAIAMRIGATESLLRFPVETAEDERAWRQQVVELYRDLQSRQSGEVAAQRPILRTSTLPFQRPLISPGPLPAGTGITPSYLQESPASGGGVDLAGTPDAPLSEMILAKAAELGHEYARIYEFVRTGIRTEYYAGAMKGAEATLRAGAGNDIDQASLLLALFRASNVPARYVHGVVELPVAQVGAPLGLEDPQQVLTALARAGIPHEPVIQGSQIGAVRMVHTWVSIYVPYANYRGIAVDLAGKLWLPLAPAVKSHTFEPGSNIAQAAGLTGDAFVRDYLANALPAGPLTELRVSVEAYLAANPQLGTLAEQLPSIEISEAGRKLLPSSLPFEVISVTAESPVLGAARQQLLGLRIVDDGDDVVMDEAVPLSRLVDRRVTLSYAPATVDDFNVIREFGGMATVPPYLVRLRPQLKVDGIAITAAAGDLALGATHRLQISVNGPAASQEAEALLIAGSYAAINLSAQLGLPEVQGDEEALADDTEGRAARLLANHLARYTADWDRAEEELAGWFDLAVVRPLPALSLVSTALTVTRAQGLVTDLSFTGVNLDAALRSAEPISRQADAESENHWMRLAALQGSHLESSIFEQQWAVESISADKGLRLAAQLAVAVNEVDADNAGAVIPGLSHSQEVLDSVQGFADLGYSVLIPDTEITLNAWTGSVWHVWDPDSGGSGYFISGGLAGGSTSEGPADWVLDDLANALGNPYGGEPNDDPLSAASIRLLPATDGQIGKAGQELERELLVLVTDSEGRPVQGAEVDFSVILGDAQLNDGSGDSVFTNSAGIAAASVMLGTRTDISPIYVLLESGDEFATQITENWITASVVFPDGQLPLEFPFIVYTGPAEASALEAVSGSPFGYPGSWVGPVQFRLADEFSNPISNQDMTFTAQSPIVRCGTSAAQPARLFVPGDCAVPFVPGTSSCGDSTVTVKSNAIGRYVQIINGNGPMHTRYPIRVTADGVPPFDFESLAPRTSGLPGDRVVTGETLSLGYFGNLIESAALGEITPAPRQLSVYVAREDPGDGCIFTFRTATGGVGYLVEDGGGPGSVEDLGEGNYSVLLPVADVPTHHNVRISVTGVSVGSGPPVDVERDGARVAAVEAKVESITPEPVPLNDDGVSIAPIIVNYDVQPPDFPVTLQVNLLEDDNVIDFKFVRRAPNIGQVAFAAGRTMDLSRTYEIEILVNPRTAFEIVSERFEVRLTSPIVRSVTNIGSSSLSVNANVGGGKVVNGQVRSPLRFFNDIDIPNERVCRMADINLELTQAATVSMTFEKLDVSGTPTGEEKTILNGVSFGEGTHRVDVSADDLGTDGYRWRIDAISELDGHLDVVVGGAGSSYIQRNSLPIGHPIVKGVDLATGKMTLSRQDLSVPGLGSNLQFSRSYSSGSRSEPGVIGAGWSHNYISRIVRSMCGDYYITGAEGGSMRFVQADGAFVPLKGYHGSLVQSTEEDAFDFYPKSGVRYHFTRRQDESWWLDFIEDPNGNRTTLDYEPDPQAPLLTKVTDATGRSLTFSYEQRNFRTFNGQVLISILGPGGISVSYDYDEFGNLVSAAREGGSTAERYDYMTDSNIGNANLLIVATDTVMNVTRSYEYSEITLNSSFGGFTLDILSSTVDSITEPDGGRTRFEFTAGPWGMHESAVVTDPMGNATSYSMNEYGAATRIAAPNGTRSKTWETETDVLLLSETDENGRVRSFAYDEHANVIRETTGRFTKTFTFAPEGAFSPPYIKNRLASHTDARGNTTTFTYDAAGNTTGEAIGGISATYTYDGNGNRLSATDGNGNVTAYGYDSNGNLASRTNAEGNRWRFSWDVRGRKLSETDPNGNAASFSYDDRDRLVRSTFADGSTTSISYADASRMRTETDARGNAMVFMHDAMVRVISMRNGLGDSMSMDYDLNGNKTRETDFAGRATTFSYDGANRILTKTEPEGRVTTFSYDGVGNVLTRTVSGAGGSRSTTYGYDRDLYLQTSRTQSGLATTTRRYDGKGNLLSETDPLGRVKTYTYDVLNGRLTADGPLGSGMRWTYDDAGNILTEKTLNSGGDRETRFVYDAANRQIQFFDAEGGVWSTEYDAAGNVIRQVDARGNASIKEYDSRNRKSRTIDASGAVSTFAYDPNGNLIQHVQPNGNLRSFAYDAIDRRISETDSLGPVATFSYDPVGNIVQQTDARGAATARVFDGLNRAVSETRPEGRTATFSYNVFGDTLTETDAAGNVTTHTYNALGQRTATNGPVGLNLVYTNDLVGNVLSKTDARGNLTTYAYNDLNQQISETDPLYTQTFQYDLVGNRTALTDGRGIVSTWRFDRADRLVEMTRAGSTLERRTYDANGNLIFLTDANGNQIGLEYDERNLVVRESQPELAISTLVRDAMGEIVTENRPAGRTITRTYDLRKRQISETNGNGETTTFEYDAAGNQTAVLKPLGRWETEYDLANRLVRAVDPLGNVTRFSYDTRDNRLTQTDANGRTTSFVYDARNRITEKRYPDGAAVTFGYDVADNLISQSQPNGNQIDYSYDELNRQTGIAYSLGSESITVTIDYDPNGNKTAIVESESGGAGGSITQTFDNLDRLLITRNRFGQELQYAYDLNGNRTRLLDHNGLTTSYSYDGLNRVTSIAIPGLGTATYDYLPNNLIQQLTYPNGAVADYQYDLANRATEIVNRQGGEDVAVYRYTYDANGNRTRQEETNGNGVEITTYGYDSADRLIEVVYPERRVDYLLDPVGNRLAEDIIPAGGTGAFTRTYTYNARDQLTAVSDPDGPLDLSYGYDANGNQVSKVENGVATSFDYNARNRLSRVATDGQPPVDFEYDQNGMRMAKTVSGNRTQYVYDDASLVAETNTLGNTIARYHYGADRLLAESRGAQNGYFLNEVLGSPAAITAQDGTLLARYVYDAWGNITREEGASEQPFGFTGYQLDEETGLYYAQDRYYDSFTGRFLREDPFRGDIARPPSLHRYLYAFANPTVFLDPDGNESNRQIIGIDDESVQRQIEAGETGFVAAAGYAAKVTGYKVWNFFTAGFVSRHDDRVELYDAGKITATEFHSGTLLDASASIGSVAVGGAVGGKVTGALGTGIRGTVASGAASGVATDVVIQSSELAANVAISEELGRESFDLLQTAEAAAIGVGTSIVAQGISNARASRANSNSSGGQANKPQTVAESPSKPGPKNVKADNASTRRDLVADGDPGPMNRPVRTSSTQKPPVYDARVNRWRDPASGRFAKAPVDRSAIAPKPSPPKTNVLDQDLTVPSRAGTRLKPVVLGESMSRVTPVAQQLNGHTFKPRTNNKANWLRNQRQWIRRQIQSGRRMFDIGIDVGRTDASPYYNIERTTLIRNGYRREFRQIIEAEVPTDVGFEIKRLRLFEWVKQE